MHSAFSSREAVWVGSVLLRWLTSWLWVVLGSGTRRPVCCLLRVLFPPPPWPAKLEARWVVGSRSDPFPPIPPCVGRELLLWAEGAHWDRLHSSWPACSQPITSPITSPITPPITSCGTERRGCAAAAAGADPEPMPMRRRPRVERVGVSGEGSNRASWEIWARSVSVEGRASGRERCLAGQRRREPGRSARHR
jgi:hypothetical protein